MSEQTVEEKEPQIKDFPVEWQILIRATQSLVSKARDGADIEIYRNIYSFVINSKKTYLKVTYDVTKKLLEITWEKYRILDNGEREPMFIKTFERRIEEKEALELINTVYERILTHINYKSNTKVIFRDFFYLYNMFEELKKEREEAKQ
jgi:hypothetical protein